MMFVDRAITFHTRANHTRYWKSKIHRKWDLRCLLLIELSSFIHEPNV